MSYDIAEWNRAVNAWRELGHEKREAIIAAICSQKPKTNLYFRKYRLMFGYRWGHTSYEWSIDG